MSATDRKMSKPNLRRLTHGRTPQTEKCQKMILQQDFDMIIFKHPESASRNRELLAKKEKGDVLPHQRLGVPRSWVPNNFDSSSHNSKPIAAITLIRVQHYSQGHFLTVAKSSHCFQGYSKYANPKTRQFFHQIPSDLWAKLGLTV